MTYLHETHEAISATLKCLRYYVAFRRSDPAKYDECADVLRCRGISWSHVKAGWGGRLKRHELERELAHYVNTAINRRAGIRDEGSRKRSEEYQFKLFTDCRRIRGHFNNRIRFYELETPEMRKRYGHLVSTYEA